MSRPESIFVIAGIAILFALPTSAATVYGYVADSEGRAVELEEVAVVRGPSCSVRGARFNCREVRPGTLELRIRTNDGNTASMKVYAGAGETRHNLRLPSH